MTKTSYLEISFAAAAGQRIPLGGPMPIAAGPMKSRGVQCRNHRSVSCILKRP